VRCGEICKGMEGAEGCKTYTSLLYHDDDSDSNYNLNGQPYDTHKRLERMEGKLVQLDAMYTKRNSHRGGVGGANLLLAPSAFSC
jgi:hypothetical protein